ncbi:MAG: lysostaphin resistance A-like protein [Chthoniobacterales bacterium]
MLVLPGQSSSETSHVAVFSLFFFLLMSAIVAGVAEEAAYRGYLQGPIERRHGPLVAILLTGLLFGFAHFTHPKVGLSLLPSYLLIAAVYGALAWLTNSIFPSLVLHALGNFLGGLGLLFPHNGVPKPRPALPPSVWQSGVDRSFWLSCLTFLLLAGITIWAYAALARVSRKSLKQAATIEA